MGAEGNSQAIRVVDRLQLTVGESLKEMSEGIFGLRLALPFALDHVNIWFLKDQGAWTCIDTGIANDATRSLWSSLLADALDDRSVGRLIATHFHPDHMGLAGWLCAETGAEFWTSRTEWLMARALAHDDSAGFVETGRLFDHRAGLDQEQLDQRAGRGNVYRTRAEAPPATHKRIREGDEIAIDGECWQVLIGRGHAPEMICLFNPKRALLLAADQILQKISPNIGVWPGEPEADPLHDYIESLEAFRRLPETTLVLPSHGQAFCGLHTRIDELIAHHEHRLQRAEEAAGQGRTAVEIMPSLFERELDSHQLSFALGEALAHLNYLVFKGRMSRHLDDDGRYRYATP